MAYNSQIDIYNVADIAARDAISPDVLGGTAIAIIADTGSGFSGLSFYDGNGWLAPIAFDQANAGNGLTKVGGDIDLGGNLDQNTTIDGQSLYRLDLADVTEFGVNGDLFLVDEGARSVSINSSTVVGNKLYVRGTNANRVMRFADVGILAVNSDNSTPLQTTTTSSTLQQSWVAASGGWYQYIDTDGDMNFRPIGFGTSLLTIDKDSTTTNQLSLNADGSVSLGGYGSGTHVDPATYNLAVTASGKVIETSFAPTGSEFINDLGDAYYNGAVGTMLLGHEGFAVGASDIRNVGIGTDTMISLNNSGASGNMGLGFGVLQSLVSGDGNTGIGDLTLNSLTSGDDNMAIGSQSMRLLLTGDDNVGIGSQTLFSNLSGGQNVAIGSLALRDNTATGNTAIGHQVLWQNTSGQRNTGIGYNALYNNLTGGWNVGIGNTSLYLNQSGIRNIGIGHAALFSVVDTSYNVAIGDSSGTRMRGNSNTAIGRASMEGSLTAANNTGDNNTAIGSFSLSQVAAGERNIGIGYFSGGSITSQSRNICIGALADTDGTDDYLSLGNAIYGDMGDSLAKGTADADLRLDGTLRVATDFYVLTLGGGSNIDPAPAYLVGVTAGGKAVEYDVSGMPITDTNGIFDVSNYWDGELPGSNIPDNGLLGATLPPAGTHNPGQDFYLWYDDNEKTYYHIGSNASVGFPIYTPASGKPSIIYRGFDEFKFEDIDLFRVDSPNSYFSHSASGTTVTVAGNIRFSVLASELNVAGPRIGSYSSWPDTIGINGGVGTASERPGFAVSLSESFWTAASDSYFIGAPNDPTLNPPDIDNSVDELIARDPATGQMVRREVSSIVIPGVEWRQSAATGNVLLSASQVLTLTTNGGSGTVFTDNSGNIDVNSATYADITVSVLVVANGLSKSGVQIELYDNSNLAILDSTSVNVASTTGTYNVCFKHMAALAGGEELSIRITNGSAGMRFDDARLHVRN